MSRTGWEQEHLDDEPDFADAFAIGPDGDDVKSSRCPHCCNFICTCDDDDDIIADARKRYRNLYHAQHPYNPDR